MLVILLTFASESSGWLQIILTTITFPIMERKPYFPLLTIVLINSSKSTLLSCRSLLRRKSFDQNGQIFNSKNVSNTTIDTPTWYKHQIYYPSGKM